MSTNRGVWPIFVGTALLLLLGLPVARAQQNSSAANMELCNNASSLELQIRGCTALLNTQGFNAKVLSFAYNNRGIAYSIQGQVDLAIQDYDKAINLNPNFAKPLNNRGVAYRKRGEYDRAIQDLNAALVIDPNYLGRLRQPCRDIQGQG
jgi:tetratricopeptide (TPR) repeat protein